MFSQRNAKSDSFLFPFSICFEKIKYSTIVTIAAIRNIRTIIKRTLLKLKFLSRNRLKITTAVAAAAQAVVDGKFLYAEYNPEAHSPSSQCL